MKARIMLAATSIIAAPFSGFWTFPHETSVDEETVITGQKQKLPDVLSKQVSVAIVSYKPGQASAAHRHAGSLLAYVNEGEIIYLLEGQPPVTYTTGQSWYAPPQVPHLISKNASTKRPAKLLAWLVLVEGG